MPVYVCMIMIVPVIIGLVGLITSKGKITIKEFFLQQAVLLLSRLAEYFRIHIYGVTDKQLQPQIVYLQAIIQ